MTATLEHADHVASAATPPGPSYDGVICFGGEDWWYHNRGHFDMQMMREFSVHTPVLYVNSIGMRVPRVGEGRMFLKRIARKLRSLQRGLVRVRPNFAVLSPFSIPGPAGARLSRSLLAWRVRRAARAMGIRRPLVWIACPPAESVIDDLGAALVVYQRTDRFEAFSGVDPEHIGGCDRRLKARADLTLFCSRLLYEGERGDCRDAMYVDHGVDYGRFRDAGDAREIPAPMAGLARPVVGFVGGIDEHTFDPEFFVEMASKLPEATFTLVGGCSLPEGWCTLDNVVFIGRVPYDEVADYMAACDLLIMPWRQNDWIRACNPIKLKEYLAIGRPIVTTPFDELRHYEGLVRVETDPGAFAEAIREGLRGGFDASAGRERVGEETWEEKARQVREHLANSRLERTV